MIAWNTSSGIGSIEREQATTEKLSSSEFLEPWKTSRLSLAVNRRIPGDGAAPPVPSWQLPWWQRFC